MIDTKTCWWVQILLKILWVASLVCINLGENLASANRVGISIILLSCDWIWLISNYNSWNLSSYPRFCTKMLQRIFWFDQQFKLAIHLEIPPNNCDIILHDKIASRDNTQRLAYSQGTTYESRWRFGDVALGILCTCTLALKWYRTSCHKAHMLSLKSVRV